MIEIRPPQLGDDPAIQILLLQLGYEVEPKQLRDRMFLLAKSSRDPILLALDETGVLGLIALHVTPMLFSPAPVARVTTLVVNEQARGKGIGRKLVEAGATLAKNAGCEVLELTTALHRTDAQAFYKTIGFTASSLRLHCDLT
ncbi:GNAT family N-acetyltransferase [Brucella sp. NBRC 12950]|uniref:GNAT family N-acetyltransferase n=1 Tax=Brucella sp. NBRC 12950 TaxID=2994518 RepID=UPI00255441E9|nr:GNAT family N-acetyltransferase [Brucella sp. NBRC 12950]